MRKLLIIIATISVMVACSTSKYITTEKEVIRYDSIVKIDTVHHNIILKGDTVRQTDTLISIDTIIKYRSISIDTLKAVGKFASCEGGITASKPFLNLFEKDIFIKVDQLNRTIKVKESRIKILESKITKIKSTPIWKNTFFFLFIIALLVIVLILKFK